MTKAKPARASFSLRLQPYEGSLLSEVVQYLNSLDRAEAQRRVESVLVMALLTQARLYDDSCSAEERRRCCLESCDALEKHASTLRQLVGVEMTVGRSVVQPYEMTPRSDRAMAAQIRDEDDEDDTNQPLPKARLNTKVAPADVDALFGP